MEETIAAISTPVGSGGIAVIRVSGADAVVIADRVFKGRQPLSGAATHTIHYGFAVNSSGERIDEVLASIMRAPNSFTREDVVEISTHGGSIASRRVLDALIRAGARIAEPGEFTKRAFLNGRIDLSQAEAVIDIINAKNTASQRNALSQLGGALSREISDAREALVNLAARMQVIIDYPDEDLEDITPAEIGNTAAETAVKLRRLSDTADSGRLIRDGIRCAIAGKPNVGKSSLMNLLSGEDRAIVTDIAGTTRDVIEESVSLDGVPLVLIDTAGIHYTEDTVEKIGVERSRKSIEAADLVLVMLDSQSGFDREDMEVIEASSGTKRIILVNKCDLGSAEYLDRVRAAADDAPVIEISAVTGEGIDILIEKICDIYHLDFAADGSRAVITNMRHKTALIKAESALNRAAEAIKGGMPTDIASIDINEAIDALGEITGETVSDSIVSEIFHSFCVGK
ncbi:MAG: tRNA uridine-5-carboxymethylaminomethyl(34) synthesis GTPase MnmE [bacterium]|nr:tRNA uridine-5-carboxymethylaminomethyl(34) synthesis GTPase MnmE [bacterium]